MGLISEGDVTQPGSRYAILSDIQGMEDHLGDMDFKVAGTPHGITALQMDIKIKGLSYEMMEEALAQAHAGRLHILEQMLEIDRRAARRDVAATPRASSPCRSIRRRSAR